MSETKVPTLNRQDPANSHRLQSLVKTWWRKSTPAVRTSLVVFVVIVLLTLFADLVSPYDPNAINLRQRLQPPIWLAETGSWQYPLGTDATGRDVLTRTLYGGQASLFVGITSTLIGLVVGTFLGVISGYVRGWVDQFIMYLVDVQLSLPFILLAVAVALVLGKSLTVLMGIAALSTWPFYARVVRGTVLSLREREFFLAAKALGGNHWHIMVTHLLPNLLSPVFVLATLNLNRIILLESGLSFLGIGVQPPTPSWGNMINEGRDYLNSAWWLAVVPGTALAILAIAVGTIGDWLRDVTDVVTQ